MKKRFSLLLAAIMCIGALAGCQSGTPATGDTSENSGAAGGNVNRSDLKLTVYAGCMEDHMVETMALFQEQTGVKVEAVRMSSGEILGRVRAEKDNPKASIWFGGPTDGYIQAAKEGLLEQYVSPEIENIAPEFRDKDNYWTGVYYSYLGFASNQKLLDERGVEAPTSWQDLLKPEFEGQISIADPGSSGTAYTALATVVQLMGEEDGMKFMQSLDKNVKSYEKSGSAPARLAGQGEAMVSCVYLNDALKFKEEGFSDLVLTSPSEGTGLQVSAVAIIKGGEDMEAAKIFYDWALGVDSQEVGRRLVHTLPTNTTAPAMDENESVKGVTPIDYDHYWAGENRDRLVEEWNKAVKGE